MAWTATVADYLAELRKLGQRDFLVAYPNPVLLSRGAEAAPAPQGFHTDYDASRQAAPASAEGVARGDASDLELVVHEVKKRPSSPYEGTITVGRASSSDLVLPHADISKLHAYLQVSGDRVTLGDAGSANRTRVDGKELAPRSETALGERALLQFAEYRFLYLSAPAFALWLAGLSGPSKL